VEASALHAPVRLNRLPLATPLLRLRSDEQLVALFRAGSDEAFGVLHERYRQRLFGYVRQMLSGHSRQDAEDVLQDVFVRAFGALRNDDRTVNVRAWLYRVAHNRCIDHLRRPQPPAAEIFEMSRKPLLDPVDEAQRRDDLRRLVGDLGRLPEQQRSALLMREIDGLSYAELAGALDVTVPAVKSLLVRARVGLVAAQESRDADCGEIRRDLMASYDRGVKASGRARRHLRECDGCSDYRHALRDVRRSFAALTPAAAGPAALLAKLIGVGGAGGGAAAAGGGGGGAVLAGGAATATACKVAAVVCATAITAGGAVEVRNLTDKPAPPRERSSSDRSGSDRSGSAARAAAPSTAAAPARTRSGTAAAFPTPSAAFRAQRDHAVHGGAPVAVEEANGAPKSGSFVLDGESPALVDDAPQVASGVSAEPGPQPQQQQQEPEPAQQQPAETGTVSEPVISVPPVSAAPVVDSPAPDAHAPALETPADPSVGLELETAPATPVEP
jgi:RNA polymerase sigma factor (sigma-70 family)